MDLRHYSGKPLSNVYSVQQEAHAESKPRGLWVSVLGEDDWPSWCRSEKFALESLEQCLEVVLAIPHNILILNSIQDIDEFHEQYNGPLYPGATTSRAINWQRVAESFHGIIIAPYQWGRRLDDKTGWYYGWDCASGCIWDASAIASITPIEEKEPKP